MSFIHPHPALRVRESEAGLVVDLPSPRRPLTAFVVALWLAGWAVGLAFIVQQVRGGEALDPDRVFLFAWAAAWLAAGAVALAWLAWLVAGRERIVLAGGVLRLRRSVLGLGPTRSYRLDELRELRTFGREVPTLLAFGLDVTGRGASGVRCRRGERVVRFARSLDEHAAHELVGLLRAHGTFGERHPERPAAPAA